MRMGDLLDWYQSLPGWRNLAPNSRRNYGIWLRTAIDIIGESRNVSSVNHLVADRLLLSISHQSSTHNAVSVCRMLSIVWNHLIRYQIVQNNPFNKMKLPSLQPRRHIWNPEQIYAFSMACTDLGYNSLGTMAEMCWVFCQRPIDMRLLRRTSFTGSTLNFTQQKTHITMSVYVPQDWRDRLWGILESHNNPYILINPDTGMHYTSRDYNKIAFDAKRKAHIPIELQLRDLRRTGLTEAANGGATDSELMSLGGHTKTSSLNIYRLKTAKQTENALNKRGMK
jgi:hypothetical protein